MFLMVLFVFSKKDALDWRTTCFYLAHFCVLTGLSLVLSRGNIKQTYMGDLLALILLYPIYRTLKWRYPQCVLRFM